MEEPDNSFVDNSNFPVGEPSKIPETSESEKYKEDKFSEPEKPQEHKEHSNSPESKIIEKRKQGLTKFFFGWVEDNYDKAFIAILVFAFAIRFWVFLKTFDQAVWFDAAEYLSTAKYWAGVGNMSDIWYYRRGFFWPLFCSLFFRLGLGDMTIRFITVLFSTGIVAVSYFLIKEMFNKKYALFSTIGLSLSWVILFFTGRPMTSIPATFFLLTSLLFFWKGYELNQGKKYIYLFAFFFALSVMTRMQMLMFVPVFLIHFFIKEKFKFIKNKSLWIALLIFVLTMLPNFIVYNNHFGNPIEDILSYNLGIATDSATTTSERSITDIPMFFKDLPYNLTKTLFIFFLIGVPIFFFRLFIGFDRIFKDKIVQKLLFVFLWIVIPLSFLGLMGGYAQQRYTLAQYPFFILIAAIPLFKIEDFLKKNIKSGKRLLTFLLIVGFIAILIPNLLWANNLIEDKLNSYYETKLAGGWIKEHSNLDDIIITESFPQISYYSERRVVTFASGLNNPENHGSQLTQEEFYEFVETEKPRFLVLSVFQNHEDWQLNYPIERSDILKPIKAYPEDSQQPLLIIYEFNYDSSSNV